VPVKGLLELLKEKRHDDVIVWLAMLSEAHLHPQWRTSSTIRTVAELTGLSPNTVQKSRHALPKSGHVRVVSGGGGSRKKVIYAVTRIATFTGKPGQAEQNSTPPKKPVGDW
jgi:DNA-binding IscR family transcriptional regulator